MPTPARTLTPGDTYTHGTTRLTVTARPYIDQVAKALANAGVPVAHVRIDSPEQAAELGRQWACIHINTAQPTQALVWSDWNGWLVSTHADHYPLLPAQTQPPPAHLAAEARSIIHTLAHGGRVSALPLS